MSTTRMPSGVTIFAMAAAICLGACGETPTSPPSGSWPTSPPARICGNAGVLNGPSTAPAGAVVVPPGDNAGAFDGPPGTVYWLAPGVHTLGSSEFSQIIPKDNMAFIGAPRAVLDGQSANRYAFTQHATGVTIKHLTIRNFGPGAGNNDEGVVNHDAGENWTVTNNTVINNDGAGVFIGSGNVVAYNCLKDNGQYGFSSYHPDGIRDVVLDHNEIVGNNTDDWETLRPGCGCTGGGKFWDTHGAVVTNNWVHNNRGSGLWADDNNSGFRFEGNYIESNDALGLFYEVSYNFLIRNNTFVRNALGSGKEFADRGDPFPNGAIYISESGGDTRAGSQYAQSEITSNFFENNWDGIVLWENADRFCRPDEPFDTTNGCPFFDQTWGIRYKTQNITIHQNEFRFDAAAIGCTNSLCGRMAVFSNYGTYPANSPYLGTVIQEAITFQQNNRWRDNRYVGAWRFMTYDMSHSIDFSAWRAGPYNQDANSTLNE